MRRLTLMIGVIGFLGLGLGLWSARFISFSENTSLYLHAHNLVGDYVSAVLLSAVIFVGLLFIPFPKRLHRHVLTVWILRSLVTLIFMLYYEAFYNLDSFHFFQDSILDVLSSPIAFGEGSQVLTWLLWQLNQFLPFGKSYHGLKVIFSLIGFIGAFLFYRGATRTMKQENVLLFWGVQGFPSVLFWSSTLGKDPLTFFAIALYFWAATGLLQGTRLRYVVGLGCGVLLAASIRVWLAPILAVPFLFCYVVYSDRRWSVKAVILSIATVGSLILFSQVQERFRIKDSKDYLKRFNTISHAWKSGGSAQEAPEIHSAQDFLRFVPLAMFTSLFRPLPGEVNNMFGALAGVENFFLISLFFYGATRMRKRDWENPLIVFCLILLLTWSSIYGLASFQNLGTAARFKLQVLPVLIIFPSLILLRRRSEQLGDAN